MSPKAFIKMAEKRGWTNLVAIKKEAPPGSGRFMLLGIEFSRRSRKYAEKYLFSRPLWLHDLQKTPTREDVEIYNQLIADVRNEPAPDLTDFTPDTDTSIAPARVI